MPPNQVNEDGTLKPHLFNAAIHSGHKTEWLLKMAAEGKLSEAQVQVCKNLDPEFHDAVKKTQNKLGITDQPNAPTPAARL